MKRWIAVLALAALCGWGLAWAGRLPVTQQGGVNGGGGYTGGSLDGSAAVDTIGPVNVGACGRAFLYAQWSGDSCSVVVERSIDYLTWFPVTALAGDYLGQDDSVSIWYSKIVTAAADSAGVAEHGFGPWLRARFVNMTAVPDSVAADSNAVSGLKGGITCVD